MSDLISRSVTEKMLRDYAERKFFGGEIELANGILKAVNYIENDNIPTAFDLESVIVELEGISKYTQSEANDLASIGDYGCATKFEGMAQAYKDCVNILKSAANATNGKNGG